MESIIDYVAGLEIVIKTNWNNMSQIRNSQCAYFLAQNLIKFCLAQKMLLCLLHLICGKKFNFLSSIYTVIKTNINIYSSH